MFAQENVMEIQKQKNLYLAKLLEQEVIKQDEFEDLVFKPEINAFHSNYLSSRFMDNINFGWSAWQAATAQAVPEGFVLVPVKEIKTWYLDDSENIYREDPDWLCDISIGEVVEVEHRVSYELDQDPVFAAIQWDEKNSDVGYYETFKSKAEAEKVAAHCKAMVEAQELKS
jgi:hypothetical protein